MERKDTPISTCAYLRHLSQLSDDYIRRVSRNERLCLLTPIVGVNNGHRNAIDTNLNPKPKTLKKPPNCVKWGGSS